MDSFFREIFVTKMVTKTKELLKVVRTSNQFIEKIMIFSTQDKLVPFSPAGRIPLLPKVRPWFPHSCLNDLLNARMGKKRTTSKNEKSFRKKLKLKKLFAFNSSIGCSCCCWHVGAILYYFSVTVK